MESMLLEIGIGGIVALMILKEVFVFLKSRNDTKNEVDMYHVAHQIDELYKWHDKDDPSTGAKIWYFQKSLEEALVRLNSNLEIQTQVLQDLYRDMKETKNIVKDLNKKDKD